MALEHDKRTAAPRAFNNLADRMGSLDRYPEAETYLEDGLVQARRVGESGGRGAAPLVTEARELPAAVSVSSGGQEAGTG